MFAAIKDGGLPLLLDKILMRVQHQTPARVPYKKVPGMDLTMQRLANPRCAQAVGGEYAKYVRSRAEYTDYYRVRVMAARETNKNGLEVIYAYSDPISRRIALLPPFYDPLNVQVETDGKPKSADTIKHFEEVHRFVRGSVTVEKLQSLILAHELSHGNQAQPEDYPCMAQSMCNTRTIAEACFPEIVDHNAQMLFQIENPIGCSTAMVEGKVQAVCQLPKRTNKQTGKKSGPSGRVNAARCR